MKDTRFKAMEWNINQRSNGNFELPDFIITEICKHDIDILVEYKQNEKFESKLREKGYLVFTNSPQSGNEVLIAVKKSIIKNGEGAKIISRNIPNEKIDECPNFLRVDANIDGQLLTIIGTRVRIGTLSQNSTQEEKNAEYYSRRKQVENLAKYLNTVMPQLNNAILIMGDFNNHECYKNSIWNADILSECFSDKLGYKVVTPEKGNSIGTDEEGYKVDHIIAKEIEVQNPLYYWKYKHKDAIYKKVEKIKPPYPDHAILSAEINLISNENNTSPDKCKTTFMCPKCGNVITEQGSFSIPPFCEGCKHEN